MNVCFVRIRFSKTVAYKSCDTGIVASSYGDRVPMLLLVRVLVLHCNLGILNEELAVMHVVLTATNQLRQKTRYKGIHSVPRIVSNSSVERR